jgi:hypothetical protein
VNPIAVVNDATGGMVVGHGRREALIEMKRQYEPAPDRIQVRDGEWLVPVLHGVSFANAREAEAYLIADNKLTEAGGYDKPMLSQMFTEFRMEEISFDGLGIKPFEMEQLQIDLPGNTTGSKDQSGELGENFQIVVTCANENEQGRLLERFTAEGLKCRALI